MGKRFWILVGVAILLMGSAIFIGAPHLGADVNGATWLVPIIGFAALVDSINPCAFSVLLLTIAFLFSLGSLRNKILKVGFAYIAGIFATYVLIGLGILQALTFFGIPKFMSKAGALILVIFGLIDIINEFFPSFPIKLKIPQSAHNRMAVMIEKASVPTAIVLGVLVGLYEFPCTGGPYLFVLGLLHDSALAFKGFLYLLFYNFIFVLPLAVILLIASDKAFLEKMQLLKRENSRKMRFVSGLAMVGIGLLMFFFFS